MLSSHENIRGYQNKQQFINYHTMAEPATARVGFSPSYESKKSSLLDQNGKNDLKKYTEKRNHIGANGKNPTNGEKLDHMACSQADHPRQQMNYIHHDLQFLRHQIESLQTYDQLQLKQRYQSEAFILRKRRNNQFRGFIKTDDYQHSHQKQDRSIILDNFINRKKPANKNSMKIKKFLTSYLSKPFEDIKINHYLQFISTKHKIPLETIQKIPKLQIGYKQSDVRKVKKYQINVNNLPPMGISFDNQSKLCETQEEIEAKIINNTKDILNQELECYDEPPHTTGYLLPDKDFTHSFAENKRELFKVSRNMMRNKLQKESTLKRLAYHCVRQVQKRYTKCVRNQNDYINRAKKLNRECLVYWRKREKELIQLKKKKDKLELELKKRDEEQQQAKKQQKRLQYIIHQSGLYSHFMATKLGVDGDQKKQLENIGPLSDRPLDIDEEAAQLSVNQIINNKKTQLQQYDKKKDQRLDLSSVDQGKIQLVGTPSGFHGTLKEYQIKGLRWLNNLFEQGINGILADQMGLGKTIQAIALLSHITQTKGIWGPFLIVAPNSTLFNWQQQFKKFCPSLKILPYWGNIKQRKTIRKFFSSKKFTQKPDSPFHVVITSYQLTVTDEKTFKRLKWQFMVLDEAQAIKNISSQRWNTLKEFQSRNRLLLTGTPIQNNMAELWALLNFVMPDLFDSHELFNQWFSKDIEAHSQDQKELDQIKIQRLQAILKPFMLRRIKKDVEHEIGKKFEHRILCEMTKRQKLLYDSIKQKLNLKDLFKMLQSKAKVENLMNLVMQLRKVCNHPQLFERRPARSPFCFQQQYYYTGYTPIKAGQIKLLSNSVKNPINFHFPKMIYERLTRYEEPLQKRNKRLLNIYHADNQMNNKTFSCMALTNFSISEVKLCFQMDSAFTGILLLHWWRRNNYSRTLSTSEKIHINKALTHGTDPRFLFTKAIEAKSTEFLYMPSVTSPLIEPIISSLAYCSELEEMNNNKFQKYFLEGRYPQKFAHYFNQDTEYKGVLNGVKSLTYIQVIDFGSLIADSSKLRELDKILKEKKRNNDKVLIFCQMTKMIDILEDFMNLRKYTFFRLDGASNIADRRDMVNDFQKPSSKVFVFLLSTRAGGLGVTLTAANTVIFYDNDWNPTMDAQATDRAHRIGQSQNVNVYQLVTKNTIEQRIVKRAQQKKTVQATVYEGGSFNIFKKDIIMQLMVDEFKGGEIMEEKDKQEKDKEREREKTERNRKEKESGQAKKKGPKAKISKEEKDDKGKLNDLEKIEEAALEKMQAED